jgi:hypothetical protein
MPAATDIETGHAALKIDLIFGLEASFAYTPPGMGVDGWLLFAYGCLLSFAVLFGLGLARVSARSDEAAQRMIAELGIYAARREAARRTSSRAPRARPAAFDPAVTRRV